MIEPRASHCQPSPLPFNQKSCIFKLKKKQKQISKPPNPGLGNPQGSPSADILTL